MVGFPSLKTIFCRREAVSGLENLDHINAALQKLTAAMDAYPGGFVAAIPVSRSEAALITAMKNGIQDAKAAPELPTADADIEGQKIVDFLRTTLYHNMKADMASLRAKRDLFAAANVLGILMLEIKGMRDITIQLVNALMEKAPQHLVDESRPVLEAMDAEFESVIKDCA